MEIENNRFFFIYILKKHNAFLVFPTCIQYKPKVFRHHSLNFINVTLT